MRCQGLAAKCTVRARGSRSARCACTRACLCTARMREARASGCPRTRALANTCTCMGSARMCVRGQARAVLKGTTHTSTARTTSGTITAQHGQARHGHGRASAQAQYTQAHGTLRHSTGKAWARTSTARAKHGPCSNYCWVNLTPTATPANYPAGLAEREF